MSSVGSTEGKFETQSVALMTVYVHRSRLSGGAKSPHGNPWLRVSTGSVGYSQRREIDGGNIRRRQ